MVEVSGSGALVLTVSIDRQQIIITFQTPIILGAEGAVWLALFALLGWEGKVASWASGDALVLK